MALNISIESHVYIVLPITFSCPEFSIPMEFQGKLLHSKDYLGTLPDSLKGAETSHLLPSEIRKDQLSYVEEAQTVT